jgi:ADP-heptose:LPS heptosyltransferase
VQFDIHDAQTVVVLRALQLGDMLCSVPALRAIREQLPTAHIALIGLPWAGTLVDRLDSLDELIEFPGFPGIPEVPADTQVLPAFFDEMQARRFDLALQMHGNGLISNAFVSLLGARYSAGFGLPGVATGLDHVVAYPSTLPEVRRHVSLVRSLGVGVRDLRLEFPLTDVDRREAQLLRRAAGLEARAYACLHPGARDPRRRWAIERFAEVGDALASDGLRVVLTGGPDDRALTAAVARRMGRPALDLAGRTSLGALAALLADAALLVSNDTGVSHLADALAVPSVVVFTASDPARWAPLDPRLHLALGGPAARSIDGCCLGEACPDAATPWRAVPASAVVTAARDLLQTRTRDAA